MSEILPITTDNIPPFVGFPSISRLSREMIVTEKIDGTNAQVYITEDHRVFAGSRSRWITPQADNFGFARWVQENREMLLHLGPGNHFGEWWGSGIQRGYGLTKGEKRFSLFNVGRWIVSENYRTNDKQGIVPECCGVVPTLYIGMFDTNAIDSILTNLSLYGSKISPGFMNPEGIVIYHEKSQTLFKKTLDGDGHKGMSK